jgi:hypothetical protein
MNAVARRITTALHRNDSLLSVSCKGYLRPVSATVMPLKLLIGKCSEVVLCCDRE